LNSMTRYALTLALAAGAALVPSQASAQTTKVTGEFNLPVKAQWGQDTLAPGHYTMAIQNQIDGEKFLRLNGPQGAELRILGAYSFVNKADVNYLRLEKIGGSYALREFHCGTIGESYSFRVPKETKTEANNRVAGPEQVLVAVSSHR
jgi:hypothetical protein